MERDKYPRSCRTCGAPIHMIRCADGEWRAFDFPSETSTGKWGCTIKGGVVDGDASFRNSKESKR